MSSPTLVPDISHWQGLHTVKDFRKAKRLVAAFIFKATDGTTFTDGTYASNASNCRQAGLPFGAYHYVQQGSPASQASHFLNVAMPHKPAFVMVDWEAGDKGTARGIVTALRKHLPNDVPVLLYCGVWARTHGGPVGNPDAVVVPDYGPPSLPNEYVPKGVPLAAWQYTDGPKNGTKMPSAIPGIGSCDVSVVYLPRFFGITPPPPPKPKHVWRYIATGDATKYRLAGSAWRKNAGRVKAGTDVTFKRVDVGK